MNTPSLTAVLHEDFKSPRSGLTGYVIADLLPRNYQTLMSELSRQPGHKLGADLVLPLMQKTGSTRAMNFLAREMGGVFVPLPEGSPNCPPAQQQCLVTVKEFGELMQAVGESLLDGTITAAERERIRKEGYELISAALALVRQIEAECEG